MGSEARGQWQRIMGVGDIPKSEQDVFSKPIKCCANPALHVPTGVPTDSLKPRRRVREEPSRLHGPETRRTPTQGSTEPRSP